MSMQVMYMSIKVIPDVPKKSTCLIEHRTKGFCSRIKTVYGFNRKNFKLDSENEVV